METDYKKLYEDALERAKAYNNVYKDHTMMSYAKGALEDIFPELAEREDEKIRKVAIEFVRKNNSFNYCLGISKEQVIAWLEKQGDVKFPEVPIEHGKYYYCIKDYYSGGKLRAKRGDVVQALRGMSIMILDSMEAGKYFLPVNKIEKQGEQPTDKVESKFKVHDWISNGGANPCYVKSIFGDYYELCSCEGFEYTKPIIDVNYIYHLWTIQDAKDGDVLKEDSCIFILKEIKSDGIAVVFCCLFDDGDFSDGSTLHFDIESTHPATKEQRELLFQKMKEAGYEWDAEKKELKKIEQNHAWSEDDEKMLDGIIHSAENHCYISAEERNWLKSLKNRVQPKKEWSVNDERILYNIHSYIDYAKDSKYHTPEKMAEAKVWLDSLENRVQSHWKPTKEQMVALKIVKNGFPADDLDAIKSLYEQLLKL